jgi:FkbM family methyltransferase
MTSNGENRRLDHFRWKAAQLVCAPLPPIIAQRVRSWIFPWSTACRLACDFERRSITGSMFSSNTADFHGYPFSVHGYYEWRNLAIAAAVTKPGDCILEIGANVGTETIGFADIVGKHGCVHAFEPFPPNVRQLKRVVAQNPRHQIVVHPVALSDRQGTIRFESPPPNSSGVGHICDADTSSADNIIEVECATLDGIREQLPAPAVIFLDTEGEEVRVLRGGMELIRRHAPHIVLEASPKLLKRAGTSLEELLALIRSLGYVPFEVTRVGLDLVKNDLATSATNWLCLKSGAIECGSLVSRKLRRIAFSPPIMSLNPLVSVVAS